MQMLAQIASDRSCAVFVVTHDPRIVSFADRIVHIEDGSIVKDELKRGENASREESRVTTARNLELKIRRTVA